MPIATRLLAEGRWLHIFPEGRVSFTGELLPLKWGVGHVLCNAVAQQAPGTPYPLVVPFYHTGMGEVYPPKQATVPRVRATDADHCPLRFRMRFRSWQSLPPPLSALGREDGDGDGGRPAPAGRPALPVPQAWLRREDTSAALPGADEEDRAGSKGPRAQASHSRGISFGFAVQGGLLSTAGVRRMWTPPAERGSHNGGQERWRPHPSLAANIVGGLPVDSLGVPRCTRRQPMETTDRQGESFLCSSSSARCYSIRSTT